LYIPDDFIQRTKVLYRLVFLFDVDSTGNIQGLFINSARKLFPEKRRQEV